MATEFTPFASLAGGALIGLAAVMLMALHGKIAGMTGIVAGVIPPAASDWAWRAAFLLGTITAPALMVATGMVAIPFQVPVSTAALVTGGLIVGVGVTLGGGCTSGHGVCGMARLSPRSIVATLVFMAATFATVFVVRHLIGA
ncbi:MAG: YeeE/YedE family protein [Rhizobiaceae bacterium]